MADTYDELLAKNLRAARAAADLSQADVAERMRALGFHSWLSQTMSASERARRRVTAAEVFALGLCLGTDITMLMLPPREEAVMLPAGRVVELQGVGMPPRIWSRGWWDGNEPKFPTSPDEGEET